MDIESIFSRTFDDLIMEEMERTNTPGTAVAVVDGGDVVLTRVYGARDFELNLPVTPDTLFNVASVTKSLICAAVLRLEEQGKLQVSDPVSEHLPVTVGDDSMRIWHLMTHTSGIPNLADGMWSRNREHVYGLQDSVPRYPFSTWDDAFRFINGAGDFVSRPGERFHYNNLAYGLLSKIISDVAGESFKQYIRRELLRPLGMERSGFFTEVREDPLLSKGYMDRPGSRTREFFHVPYEEHKLTRSLDEAAGGLFSTVEELGNYMLMHLGGGEFRGRRVLSEESVEAMQAMQFREEYPNAAFAASYGQRVSGYGYGFAIDEDFYGRKLVQHSGSFIGASAWFCFLPGEGRGVVMLSNHHPSPRIMAQGILAASLGVDVEREWPLLKLRNHHSRLTGMYETYRGMNRVKVVSEGGALFFVSEVGRNQLIPLGGDPFTHDYYVLTEMGGKEPVQFVEEGEDTWLFRERNRWRRVSSRVSLNI